MCNRIFDLLLCREGFASRPRIDSESHAERLQIGIVLWARFLLWRDKRSGKLCVCNDAIESKEAGCQTNTPEYDRPSDRMDSLSQRDQAGNARDDQREQADRYQDDEGNNNSSRAGILGRLHSLSSLVCA